MKTKTHASTRYLPFGDCALLIEFGEEINLKLNQRVVALDEAILKAEIQEVEEIVPTYRSLLVRYNPLRANYEQITFRIRELEHEMAESPQVEGRIIRVPVVYGGECGPDLNAIAQIHGLTEEQVVKLHSETEYRVYMIGFIAGFPYLGKVPDAIATPRLETPRLKVPAGSVGIAEKQTGIYPCEAPGGWRIIGRTPVRLFDPLQLPPAMLRAGDTVRFEPVSQDRFKAAKGLLTKGMCAPHREE